MRFCYHGNVVSFLPMNPRLTKELRHAIDALQGAPVYLVDADTHKTYVLLSTERYQHVRPLLEPGEWNIRETYPLQEHAAGGSGWNDPIMDDYDAYDLHHKTV